MFSRSVKWAVILVTALLFMCSSSYSQEHEATPARARQYLSITKLLSTLEYDKAFAEGKKIIEQSPQFEFTYSKVLEAAQGMRQAELAESFFSDLLKRTPVNPRAYYGLALIYRQRGEYEKASRSVKQCLSVLPEFTPAYRVLSDIYAKQKRLAEVQDYFSSIIESNPVAFYGLGHVYYLQKKWSESLAVLDRAPPLYDVRRLKGQIWLENDQDTKALNIFQSLLLETRSNNEIDRQARVQNDLGLIQLKLGDYQQAINNFAEVLQIADASGELQLQVACLLNLGNAYQRQDNYPLALNCWLRGLPIARSIKSRQDEGTYLGNLGLLYHRVGNIPPAIDYYRQAIEITKEAADERAQATFLTNLGSLYLEIGEYLQAKNHLSEAILVARASRSSDRESAALSEMANLHSAQKDYQTALNVQTEALQLAQKVQNPVRIGNALISLGALHFKLSNWPEALRAYEEAKSLGTTFGVPRVLWQAHSGLAAVYAQQRELAKAEFHYRQAIAAMEHIRALLGGAEEKAGFFQDKVEAYKKLIAVLLKPAGNGFEPKGAAEAFHIAERARARAFSDLLAEAKLNAEQGLAPDLFNEQQQLQRRLSDLNDRLIKEKMREPARQNQAELKRLEDALTEADSELANWWRKHNRRYAELKYPEPVALQQARALLDDKTVLLAYTLGEDASYLFAVSRSGYEVRTLPNAAVLSVRIGALVDSFAKGTLSPIEERAAAAELYQVLLQPVAALLEGKDKLIVVPDGALHRLPFEVLQRQLAKRAAKYLVEDFAISYAPSVTALASLQQKRPANARPPKDFIAFADPLYPQQAAESGNPLVASLMRAASNDRLKINQPAARARSKQRGDSAGRPAQIQFRPLPHSRREAQAIARLFPDAQVFLGARASEEQVKATDLSQYRLVHFSAHGLLNEQRPRFSGLVLSLPQMSDAGTTHEDGLLSAYEIFNLKLNAELVTLSACETGLGKEVKGEGLMSLMRAFMYAGTPSVLVSLWKVDDASTAELMIEFYKNLQQGAGRVGQRLSKAEALRQAQLKFIRRRSEPYFWAPFVLIGRAD